MSVELYNGDCLEVMAGLPDSSVDLILTDPPYFKVKGDAWDNQWDKPSAFLDWLGEISEQWERLLKPNGSLYVFASPQMAAWVEARMAQRFNVLNHIVWVKNSGWSKKASKEALRCFFPSSERIIFCEHYNSDNIAKGEAGYVSKCDELRGFIFEPLRAYLSSEWERAGLTARDANIATNSQMAGHYLTKTQWALPTESRYEQLREYANQKGGDYLKREYDDLKREYDDLKREYDDLKREYDDLKREYDDLRRPFYASKERPFTDVWVFDPVKAYAGKHPCEKPLDLLTHIIQTSSRQDAVVLDSFMGSGSTGVAARMLGRKFIGIELSDKYYAMASANIGRAEDDLFGAA